jgi:protein O-GlcNAc transferase
MHPHDILLAQMQAQVLAQARSLLSAGQGDNACNLLRQAIVSQPKAASLWLLLGQAEFSGRRFAAARQALTTADALSPNQPRTYFFLGICERELDDLGASIAHLRIAAQANPPMPEAAAQLGASLALAGHTLEAVQAYQTELQRFPANARAYNNLADCLRKLGRLDEAILALQRAVGLNPQFALAWRNMGDCLSAQRKFDAAVQAWQQVIELNPKDAQAYESIGLTAMHLHQMEVAQAHLERACALRPMTGDDSLNAAPTFCALSYAFAALNKTEQARNVSDAVLNVMPHNVQAAMLHAFALPRVPKDNADIDQARTQFERGLADVESTFPQWPSGMPIDSLWGVVSNNFYLAYHGRDDLQFQTRHANWLWRLLEAGNLPTHRQVVAHADVQSAPIRVAFLSGHLYDCTAGKYFERWITGLANRPGFDVTAYYYGSAVDALTERISSRCKLHRVSTSPAQIADAITLAQHDVLIYPEIGMESVTYLLANMRLAPLQCAAWGHPITTGSREIDVYFSVSAMEPEGAQQYYREELVCLPGIGTQYTQPAFPSRMTRGQLGLPTDGKLLLCPQSLFKIHPDCDAMFARVFAQLRERNVRARLVLFEDMIRPITAAYRERFSLALKAQQLNWDDVVVLLPRGNHVTYLAVNQACDAMLDTLHWSGGNTTIDALSVGLPVVTLPGQFMRGRQSAAMLKQIGLDRLVASTQDEYTYIAVKLASDFAFASQARTDIFNHRERGKVLFDDPTPIESLASFLHERVMALRSRCAQP